MSIKSSSNPGMAERIRAFDWAATSLGPREDWSQRLQLMVEQVLASPLVASLVCGPDRLLIYNDTAAQLYGDQHPAALGRPLPTTFPAGWETVAPFYERAFAGEVVTIAGQPLDTRGEGAPTEVIDALLSPVREDDGHVAYVHMTGFDIAERQHSEAALRESREQLSLMLATAEERLRQKDAIDIALGVIEVRWQLALEATDLAVYEWNLDSDHLVVNDRFRELIMGTRSDGSAIGAHIMQECVHPDDRLWIDPSLARAMEGASNGKFSFEHRLNRLDSFGEAPWVLSHGQVVFDGQGNDLRPVRVFGTLQDISERKRAEHALRESDERKAFLLELSDAVRPLVRPTDIQGETTRLMREELHAGWCYYVDWDLDKKIGLVLRDSVSEGLPSLAGAHDVSDALEFVQLLAAGEVLTVSDYANYEQLPARIRQNFTGLGFRSMMAAPLVKDGRLIATLLIGDTRTRDWDASESSLLLEVAERTWAAIERARAEAALRESEERLRQFGEASQDVLWIRDSKSLQWQYLSPAFEAIYGMSRVAALAGDDYRNWQELILAEDREHAVNSIARVAQGEQVVFEYRIRRPADGQVRWMRDTDFPISGDAGKALRIGGVGQDITALKATEKALAAAEQRQRLLLEGMPQLVWRAVDEGKWTWAGPQWTHYTGQSSEASQEYGWLDALHPDDREVALAAWRRAPEDGLYQVDYRVRDVTTGLYHWFQTRGIPVRHTDGTILEWLGTSTDIDDQVQAREYLTRSGIELEQRVEERTAELQQALDTLHREVEEHERAEERLRQSEKLKAVGQLTGGIAHDFNNMLQGITSALALVQARLAQGRVEAAQEYIEPAQKAAVRAGALTHRLLAFSRQQALSPRPVNLERIARDMEDMVRRTVGPAVQVELKSINGQWLVLCDPNQMESALLNLCINARDAMPSGGWLTIGLEDRMLSAAELAGFEELSPGRFVMLSVTDTGTGMPKEVVARAFEPFFTTKPLGQGTGLGLSQIYGFIRQSGGLVQIETAPGKGTTVRMGLPVHEAVPEAAYGVTKNGKTLLLVEDENDLRRMLAVQLRDLGYGVLEADTADTALRVLNTGTHVDLLVTDVGLRGGRNGRELAEAARMDIPNLPVIFVTGFPGENFAGAGRVLQKPFKFSMLALLIQEQIG